jgi:hypothetical protein
MTPAVAGGSSGGVPAKPQVLTKEKGAVGRGPPVTNTLPELLQNPVISGKSALEGGCESEKNGLSSLSVRADLQDILKCLTDIRGQVDLGLKRVEETFQKLEQRELMGLEEEEGKMGCNNARVCQRMGLRRSTEDLGWIKPKRKKNRNKFANQTGLLGPKPAKVSEKPGPKSSFQFRVLSRQPEQQPGQAGESSERGAARLNGEKESICAGVNSGEQPNGVGAPESARLAPIREADMAGGHAGGSGQSEGSSALLLSIIPESAEALGNELASPVKLSGLLSVRSNIPESDAVLGLDISTPVKGSKRSSDSIEYAGELGFEDYMPVNLSKQLKVFQRRESPLSKPTKSWVAERVSWNGGRDYEASKEDFPVLGDLGGIRNQAEENPDVEGPLPQLEEQPTQGIDEAVPISKELVWKVQGTAGLSCGGQVGKLKETLGNIVDEKYGEGASSSTRVEADGVQGMRDADFIYEA